MDLYMIIPDLMDKNPSDLKRVLTEEGKNQAQKKRASLPKFEVVFCSIAERTRETADIISKESEKIKLSSLYLPREADGMLFTKEYSKLGENSLASYLAANPRMPEVMVRYGSAAWDDLSSLILRARADDKEIENILIIGHGILIQAIALIVIMNQGCDSNTLIDSSLLLNTTLKECEGFRLRISWRDGKVFGLEKI